MGAFLSFEQSDFTTQKGEFILKLSFEQIKAITVGAIRIEEESDGIHFYKCTQKQIDAWMRQSVTLGGRAAGSTGVRLDFHTNSEALTVRIAAGKKYELYVNGLMRQQYDATVTPVISTSLCDPLGDPLAEKRVTLYFPAHDTGAVLQSVELDDGATLVPHRFDRKMLFIGDSITQGWAADHDSLSYAQRVSRFFNADSVIQGIGGAYYLADSFDHLPYDPDVVLVAYGTNDFGHYKTQESFREQVVAHLGLLAKEYAGKQFFVLSPIWRGNRDGKAMGSFQECRQIVIDTAKQYGLTHIDGLDLVPPMPAFFMDDLLHPNDNGFALYAENLVEKLLEYVKR